MATLILTAVGTALGGPIGGAVGALLGHAVDARILAPKGRQGPRLGDLTVQTSTYGTAIPKLFGTLRVAGTVIWATDLREDRHKQSGAKGSAATTTYSYSASFAVALSGRPIASIGRIWAEGKLLRGAAGDWKSDIGAFRLHDGGEDGAVDPLIAAAEGETPAYRGIALAVFEDLQLADFGNRIPSLTFEVVADAAAVPIAAIATTLSDGAVAGAAAAEIAGYAASGDSVRGAIEALRATFPVRVHDDGTRLLIEDALGTVIPISGDALGASADMKRPARISTARAAEATVPDEVGVAYYEPARDWQAGYQRARRGTRGGRVDRIELPAALAAGDAKAAAERRLATALAERRTATVRLPPAWMALRPGDRIAVPGLPGGWRVAAVLIERMAIEAKLVALPADAATASAMPGRAATAPDEVAGETVIRLLDLPPLDGAPSVPALWVAAAGGGAGWRCAALSISRDAGASWQAIGGTAPPAIIGRALTALRDGDAALFDMAGSVEVELLNDGMWLESCDADALVAGANLAMLGEELIQFGTATPIGARRFRLARLLRGRRGTEAAMIGHAAGDAFVIVARDTLLAVPLDPAAIGTTVRVQAIGRDDPAEGAIAAHGVGARALRPPSPVQLRAEPLGGGAIRFHWTRRGRASWAWTDGGDVPIGEEREAYQVTITPDAGVARTAETDIAEFVYTAAMRTADGSAAAAHCGIAIRQSGDIAPGESAEKTFTLGDLA